MSPVSKLEPNNYYLISFSDGTTPAVNLIIFIPSLYYYPYNDLCRGKVLYSSSNSFTLGEFYPFTIHQWPWPWLVHRDSFTLSKDDFNMFNILF